MRWVLRVIGTAHLKQAQFGEVWVKLIPIQGVLGAETRVNENGKFEIGGLSDGKYIFRFSMGIRSSSPQRESLPEAIS